MASCNWEKLKTPQQVKAMLRHCTTDERLKVNHSNREIDKTRTHLNTSFGSMKDYETAATFYDKRIAELDATPGANKRKDRVTAIGLNIPFPVSEKEVKKGHGVSFISLSKDEWYKQVYEAIEERFGTENVIGGVVHYDEVHEYTDAETGERRQSRPHLHVYVVPAVDGRLNAKNVMSRRNMVALNNDVEKITQSYCTSFMTGTKRKSTKSVEELKNASQRLDAEHEAQRIKAEAQKRSDEILNAARVDAERIHKEAVEDAQRRSDEILNAARVQAENMRSDAVGVARYANKLYTECLALRKEYAACVQDARSNSSLEAFCKKLKYQDGKTVLDAYNEKIDENRQRQEKHNAMLAEIGLRLGNFSKSAVSEKDEYSF